MTVSAHTKDPRAVVVNYEFTKMVAELEVSVVDQMISEFLGGRFTYERAIAHVSSIATMRRMENILEGRARKEIALAQKEIR